MRILSPNHTPILKLLHFKCALFRPATQNQLAGKARDGTQEQLSLTLVHLLIEFPLRCNSISRCTGCCREGDQVTALDRIPLPVQLQRQLSAALWKHRIDRVCTKSSPERCGGSADVFISHTNRWECIYFIMHMLYNIEMLSQKERKPWTPPPPELPSELLVRKRKYYFWLICQLHQVEWRTMEREQLTWGRWIIQEGHTSVSGVSCSFTHSQSSCYTTGLNWQQTTFFHTKPRLSTLKILDMFRVRFFFPKLTLAEWNLHKHMIDEERVL